MKKIKLADVLWEVLAYDWKTGVFTWKVSPRYGTPPGTAAGTINTQGYVQIGWAGRLYLAHRLAWLYMTNEAPKGQIDHRNGARSDNSWDNLREVTNQVNQQNRRGAACNSSHGFLGVSRYKPNGQWQAQIVTPAGKRSLGYYATPEEAHAAYVAAKRELHEGCTI